MQITDYFDSKKRASAALVQELEQLQTQWPQIEEDYAKADAICIELAGKFMAARMAGSRAALEIEGELRTARWNRDRGRQNFTIKRNALHREIEQFTREPIRQFNDRCLQRLKALPAKYSHNVLLPSHDPMGKFLRNSVRISHNAAALDQAKNRILKEMAAVRSMNLCPLADVEARINQLNDELDHMDLSTLEIEEVTDSQAKEMRPSPPETEDMAKGTLMADGKIHVHPKPMDPRVKGLSDRIGKLERN